MTTELELPQPRRKLKFAVPPKLKPTLKRLGNDEIGYIDLPQYGSLYVYEQDGIAEIEKLKNKEAFEFLRYTKSIAIKEKKTPKEIQDLIQAEDVDLLDRWGEKLADKTEEQMNENEYLRRLATVMLKFRHDPEWTYEDTCELPFELTKQITVFMSDEAEGILPAASKRKAPPKQPKGFASENTTDKVSEADASKDSE